MGSAVPAVFSVISENICVFCLEKGGKGVPPPESISVKKLTAFLNMDYLKVFNIKNKEALLALTGGGGVDINVSLCRSCSKLKNKFYDLYQQYEWIYHRFGNCIQSIHEVMVNAESNVIKKKQYQNDIQAAKRVPIENTIPERFRKEAMQKCLKFSEKPIPVPKLPIEVKKTESVVEQVQAVADNNQFYDETSDGEIEYAGRDYAENVKYLEGAVEDDDDDKDPEELMMEYDSSCASGIFNLTGNGSSTFEEDASMMEADEDMIPATAPFNLEQEVNKQDFIAAYDVVDGDDTLGFVVINDEEDGNSTQDVEAMGQQQDTAIVYEGQGVEASTSQKAPTFSSNYKCEICGKVVVSLKNFELHQRRHAGEKPFECVICSKGFRDTSNLRSHALRYHRSLLFKKFQNKNLSEEEFSAALECLVMAVRKKIPRDEKKIANESMYLHSPYACRLCDKQYTQGYVIEDHVVQRHYTILAKAVSSSLQTQICRTPPEELFEFMNKLQESGANDETSHCGMCGIQFPTGEEVNLHIRSHIKIKVNRSKLDVEKSKLSSYQATSGALFGMKMRCELCQKYFEDLQGLNRHKQLYKNGSCNRQEKSDNGTFTCEFCMRPFHSYYNQRAHIVSFHRYEIFSRYLPEDISPPDIEAGIKTLLQNYRKLPMGTFECGWCLKEITQLRKLNCHVLVTHFDDVVDSLKGMVTTVDVNGQEQEQT